MKYSFKSVAAILAAQQTEAILDHIGRSIVLLNVRRARGTIPRSSRLPSLYWPQEITELKVFESGDSKNNNINKTSSFH